MEFIGPLTLTIGLGLTDHAGWVERYGRQVGVVEVSQPLVRAEAGQLVLNARHVSSVETGMDRGMNTIELHYNITFGGWR